MKEDKKTLRTVTPEMVANVKKKLKALPRMEERKLTKSEAIRELAAEIEELRTTKGYSYAAVAEEMKKYGLDVSGRTLQIALATAGRGESKAGGRGSSGNGVGGAEVAR